MRNALFWRALTCLTHPASIVAMVLVIVNALVLQRDWPSWWSGKIGDAAWMLFSPFLIAAVFAWFLPGRWLKHEQALGLFSMLVVGLGFSLVKAVPAINSFLVDRASDLDLSMKLTLDPTDLMVLPVLFLARAIWSHKPKFRPNKVAIYTTSAFSILAMLADSAPPPSAVDCLVLMEDNSVVALSNANHSPYRSYDGGFTWSKDSSIDEDAIYCSTYMRWPISVDTQPPTTFYYFAGQGFYQSSDLGKTLTLVTLEPGQDLYVAYAVATPLHTLVVSTGNGDFWTRLPNGEWFQYREKFPELILEQVRK